MKFCAASKQPHRHRRVFGRAQHRGMNSDLPHQSVHSDDPRFWRRPLDIALVTETYPPEVNGVAGTVARVVEGLRARSHRVQLVRPRQPQPLMALVSASASAPGREDLLLPSLPIPNYPGLRMGLPAVGTLCRTWRAQRPDVVHIATEGPLGWSALRAARRLGLPVTSDFRTNFQAYSSHYGIGWLRRPIMGYLRGFHNAAQCTMVPTEALRRELQAAGFERVVAVARGVDAQRFSPADRCHALRLSWGAGPDDLVVMLVGRLAPEKNIDDLMLAFAAIRSAQPRARLVLVGDGPSRAALQARFPAVIFAGMQRGDDLARHYASGDLFVFPSVTETFGNVVVEAMASGMPVLAYDCAAASLVVRTGVNGALAPVGDRAGFVRHANALAVALATDPGAIRRMGGAAREAALGLDWERIVVQIEALFLAATIARHVPRSAAALVAEWGAPG